MHIEKSIYTKDDLNEQDCKAIKVHPVVSYILMRESQTPFSEDVLQAVLSHHERLDKSGYPRALSANKINQYARIVALVDTYDALRRKGRSVDDALWAIKIHGTERSIAGDNITPAYDPQIIKVLEALILKEGNYETSAPEDWDFRQQQNQLKDLLLTLNSINTDVVQLWERIMQYVQKYPNRTPSKELEAAQNHLHKVKDLILASSGIVGIDVESLADKEDDLRETCRDVYRIAPELKNQLLRIFGTLGALKKTSADKNLAELIALNSAACKKSGELYRATVFGAVVH
jgi:hypothetical protein